MNAENLKRLFRAIADGSTENLRLVARATVDAERSGGHPRLADELSAILARAEGPRLRVAPAPKAPELTSRALARGATLSELPTSRRGGDLLVTVTPPESLEHHRVLAPEVEARFQRIEQEFAARERLLRHGLQPRRTVLLHGPPGCGKSLGAKRLAWSTGLPLMKVRFDSLLSSLFGESATNLRAVFDAARERPCVLLIDECDFIARSRTSRDVGEAARIVSSLLQLMEDYDAPGLLVATTNIEDALDEALFRRFDDVFLVPPPGPEEVQRLLDMTLANMALSPHIHWPDVLASLAGMPAAQVVRAARDAVKTSILAGRDVVTPDDLERAVAALRPPRGTDSHGSTS